MARYETDGSSALAPNDPYRKMGKAETRPNLTVIEGGRSAARGDLTAAEKVAGGKIARGSARDLEMAAQAANFGLIKNSVRGVRAQAATQQVKGSWLRRKGPMAVILALFVGGAGLFFTGQSLLGPHLSALFTEATDVQYTSYSMRNQRLFKFMMDGGDQIAITPFSRKFTTFTPYMQSRLAKNGIEVGHLNASGGFEGGDLLAGRSRVLRYNGEIISASDFQTKYANDVNFRDAYYKAKRGRVGGFFDDASEWFYKKMGMSRNIFDDYRATGRAEADNNAFRETISGRMQGTDGELNTATRQTDDNGTPDPGDDATATVRNGEDIATGTVEGETPQSKARTMVNGMLGKVSSAGAPVCAALRVANMVSIAVAANQIFQSANYFMGMMESESKTRYGEGNAAAMNEMLNFLSETQTTEVEYTDASGKTTTKAVTGSALEASGAKLVLGGIVPTEYETGAYSLDNITNAAMGAVVVGGATAVTCSGVQAVEAYMSLAATSIPGGVLAKFVVGMLAETIGGIAITGAVAGVVSVMVPMVAKALFTDIFEAYTGVAAGELYTQGAATANFQVAQTASAYMPASEERLAAQNRNTMVALAQEAELDRAGRSPFDASSKNTFLGSIVAGLLPMASSSVLSSVSAFANVVGSAVSRVLPTASAADQGVSYTSTYEECKNLEGTMCDIYGYSIPASDESTLDIEPDDPDYERVIMANMEEDGSTIRDNSELAKFITFCANRESPWGVTDANILNALQTDYGVILNNLPFLNDVVELVNAAEDTENMGWATGDRCKNSAENPYWDAEYRYYQRFIEDVRILAGMGGYEEGGNPVLGYLERYYEAHPLDASYEGTLARMMGYTRDDVAFMLEFLEYSDMIARYEPGERYVFGGGGRLGGENLKQGSGENGAGAGASSRAAAMSSLSLSLQMTKSLQNPVSDSLVACRVLYGDARGRSFAV